MDRVVLYREALRRLMADHERLARLSPGDGVDTVLVVDATGDQFILLDLGWDARGRVNDVYLHARIKDGKVWVEEDWTEEGLANELVRAGVPKEDIVLAFLSPERRRLTEFAA